MHELNRLAYLDALGVEQYIARAALPGAAPSQRLRVVQRAPQPVLPEMPRLSPAPKPAGVAAVTAEPQEQQPVAAPPTTAAVNVEAFSIAVVSAGPWLWLEDVAGVPLAREQVMLMRAMAQALGAGKVKPQVAQFDWPMHNNAQLDLGAEAARAALAGFVQRLLDAGDIRGVVLLGEASARRWQQETTLAAVTTLSTREILQNPGVKPQVWRDLRPFYTVQ